MTQQFSATIYKLGINPCVELPLRVSRTFEKRGYIPVTGKLNSVTIRATLVPVGGGKHRLFINGDMMKRSRVAVGDKITVALRIDRRPRSEPVPAKLASMLRKHRTARVAWERLTPSRRKEILRYLNFAKREETLQRNITKVVALLMKTLPAKEKLGGIHVRVKYGNR